MGLGNPEQLTKQFVPIKDGTAQGFYSTPKIGKQHGVNSINTGL